MANQLPLIKYSQSAEDVASGLKIFRDSVPSQATYLTAIISELFAVSSMLRKLDGAQHDMRREPSFYRIESDLKTVLPCLNFTLDDALRSFARIRQRPVSMVWDDLEHRMRDEEGVGFGKRMQWFNSFFDGLYARLDGFVAEGMVLLHRQILALLDRQLRYRSEGRRPGLIEDGASTPRPGPVRNISYRHIEIPTSPISGSGSDGWEYLNRGPPPIAPEIPPTSPTFTSDSSHTLNSSNTSYNDGYGVVPPPNPIHWAREVFDGGSPTSVFKGSHQLDDETRCVDTPDRDFTRRLDEDGFISVVEIDFDRGNVQVRFYWRPSDNRARVLFMTKDSRRRPLLYCRPMSSLRAVRKESCIQLCRAHREDGKLRLWANLNFVFYERMALFYSTFVAMKRQDAREDLPLPLTENHDLCETEEFGGVIRDKDLLHALRLFCDHKSGVVRLEASALRGPRKGVPLWTAFITRYATDPDWMALEENGRVSMIALKPPPYVFLAGYTLPRNRKGEFLLQFDMIDDAEEFVKTWNQLCRSQR